MPPWFDHWYHQQLLSVHQKLKDPEESRFWLDELLKKAGPPPSEPEVWRQQVEKAIGQLSEINQAEALPNGWETIPLSDQQAIKSVFAGLSPLQTVKEGEGFENLISPLLAGTSLAGEKALWIWQYLLGRIGMAEENLMRHWVDAEEENLEAFEDRYELHDKISRIPGTIFVDSSIVWNTCYPDLPPEVSRKSTSKLAKRLMVGALVISMIAAFSIVQFVSDDKGERVQLSESLTAIMSDEKSPVQLERNQLTFKGEAKLMVEVKDSIRMLGGLVIFDPGVYLIRLEDDRTGEFMIESGSLKAFLEEEVFVVEEGMILEKEAGYWLKKWE